MRRTTYTIQRIRRTKDKLYGPIHASDDGKTTVCQQEIVEDGTWFILTNASDGEPTCKKCMKILAREELLGRDNE